MADLVLGLAKSAVEGTVSMAKSAIEEETMLKKGVQRDLMLISDEFEMMNSFLNVTKERVTDDMTRTLVRQVRNMALDVEDCIESVIHLDNKSNWWYRMLPSCIPAVKSAMALDDAVSTIELLKSRVEAMGQRNMRYRHIGDDSGSKPTEKTKRLAVADSIALDILMEARNAKKQHSSPKDLIELIKMQYHALPLQVISLWGAAGDLGVASIIKKTCDDQEIYKKFRCRAWVKLMHPFNPQEFIRSLLVQFYTNYCPPEGSSVDFLKRTDVMMATEGVLIEEFMKQVREHRYLVFLEDVSSTVDWEAVRGYLPDMNNGSCIVVHSQQLEVASLCVGQSHRVLELEQFSVDHSVCVFFTEVKKKHINSTDLIKLITTKDHVHPLQVISVWEAVGDLGVASVIKKTWDDPEICQNFTCRAWVKMMHPFNPHEFIRSLLAQFNTNNCSQQGSTVDFLKPADVMMVTEDELIREFKKQVSCQRFLVFLEDVGSAVDWETVRRFFLPNENNGSCIVVHTQQLEVASLCVGQSDQVLELEQFSADHSVRAFFHENRDEDEVHEAKAEAAHEWLKKFPVVGRQSDILCIRDDSPEVFPVYGIAGVGKSYIVKHVYYKQVIQRGPFQMFGWVDISHPFNLRDFSWSLLSDLHSGSLQYGSMLRIKDPIQQCHELLHQRRCLIVIDGLQCTEEWDSIKGALAFGYNIPSRIIVIAQEESVATYCSNQSGWNVKGLEIDEALDLFRKKVSEKQGERDEKQEEQEEEGLEEEESNELSLQSQVPSASTKNITSPEEEKIILHKCGGLPKVIVAVAYFMAKEEVSLRYLSCNFMELLETHPAFGSLRDLFAWVHSYFNSCPDLLKPCIFYLSIFPMNHNIRRRRLVRRWIAEGYSRDTKERTAEENGEKSFFELLVLNMIPVPGLRSLTYFITMPLCQVNGFFREYVISRSMEDNLVFALEGNCSINSQRTGRHLTIQSSWDRRDRTVLESIDFSRLRSLTVFGQWESFFISDRMKLLRVLDLEDASSGVTDGDLELMVKLLPRLKFLSLRGCKDITRLPDSLCDLKQLQTLDIRHTSVLTLPQGITKLQKLQYIRAGTTVPLDGDTSNVGGLPVVPEAASTRETTSLSTLVLLLPEAWTHRWQQLRNGGVEVPRGIGQMTALHTLGVIDIRRVASRRAILEELNNLNQLHKLEVSGINRENCHKLCSAISCLIHLESLSVWLDKDQAGCLDAISPPPKKLQSLKLYGRVHDKLPAWIKLSRNLSKLKLQMTMMTHDQMDVLKDLPNLETLCLCFEEFEDGELRFTEDLDELQVLEIGCNCRLQAVTFESGLMDELVLLKIRCHSVSSVQFSGLKHLRNLREVLLSGSYDSTLKEHLQSQLDEHSREIKPVLKVEPVRPDGC